MVGVMAALKRADCPTFIPRLTRSVISPRADFLAVNWISTSFGTGSQLLGPSPADMHGRLGLIPDSAVNHGSSMGRQDGWAGAQPLNCSTTSVVEQRSSRRLTLGEGSGYADDSSLGPPGSSRVTTRPCQARRVQAGVGGVALSRDGKHDKQIGMRCGWPLVLVGFYDPLNSLIPALTDDISWIFHRSALLLSKTLVCSCRINMGFPVASNQ